MELQLTSAVGRRKRLPLALAAEFRYVGLTTMSRVRTLADDAALHIAAVVESQLDAQHHQLTREALTTFPRGCSLPFRLRQASIDCDALVVCVSDTSPNREWILAEMAIAELYPDALLAVGSADELPRWAAHHPERAFVAGTELPSKLKV